MMYIATAKEISRVEREAVAAGCSGEQFMENAGRGIATIALQQYADEQQILRIVLLCGKGNNGGDAYVVGRELLCANHQVEAFTLYRKEECSPLCEKKRRQFLSSGGVILSEEEAREAIHQSDLIIDGFLGTGFSGTLSESLIPWITRANESKAPVLAIDIPSGLDGNNGQVEKCAIKAHITCTLGIPKLGFFIGSGWNHIGGLFCIDFGLPESFLCTIQYSCQCIERKKIASFLPPVKRNRYKYQAGEVFLLAGWGGMEGASILSGMGALRGGAGVVRILTSKECAKKHFLGRKTELFPELIREIMSEKEIVLYCREKSEKAHRALLLGPGMGREKKTQKCICEIVKKNPLPMVIDADALHAIAIQKKISFASSSVVLTPHRAEAYTLLGLSPQADERTLWESCSRFVRKHQVTLLLKGGPSFLFSPKGEILLQSRGTPAMAKAGSGDLLSGLIAALLAQGLRAEEAALAGSTLHGLAGEEVEKKAGNAYSLIASDILDTIPHAFSLLLES